MLPLFHREATAPYGVPSSTSPSAPDNLKPKGGDWETNVVHPYGRSSLLIPTWTRCVTLIMQTMGQMVTQYQRMSKLGGNFVEDRYGKNAQLNYLLQVRPNPLMTASMMQEQIEYKKIYYGNAYVYIERGLDGYPVALWLCTGGGYNPLDNTYQITYNTDRGPRILADAPAKDVLHFRNVFLTDDYYMGIPTIDYAFKTLSIAATGDEQALQDLAKGGRHKVLLQEKKDPTMGTRGRVNPQELRKTADRFGEDWQTKDVMVLDNVTDPTIISQTAQQLHPHKEGNVKACIDRLHEQGYWVAATLPDEQKRTIFDIPVERKTAFLFGTELTGLSDEAIKYADGNVLIPMYGFTESFNISNSAAIILSHFTERMRHSTADWHLSDAEFDELYFEWLQKSVKDPDGLIKWFMQHNS